MAENDPLLSASDGMDHFSFFFYARSRLGYSKHVYVRQAACGQASCISYCSAAQCCCWRDGYYASRRERSAGLALFSLVAVVTLYGLAIEFIQKYLVANRSFDMYDLLADGLGAGGGSAGIFVGREAVPEIRTVCSKTLMRPPVTGAFFLCFFLNGYAQIERNFFVYPGNLEISFMCDSETISV